MYDGNRIESLMHMTADAMDRIHRSVEGSLHDCEICGLTPLPVGHPHCSECQDATLLKKCKECKDWYCSTPNAPSDHFRWHDCCQPDGPNYYDVTRG